MITDLYGYMSHTRYLKSFTWFKSNLINKIPGDSLEGRYFPNNLSVMLENLSQFMSLCQIFQQPFIEHLLCARKCHDYPGFYFHCAKVRLSGSKKEGKVGSSATLSLSFCHPIRFPVPKIFQGERKFGMLSREREETPWCRNL